MRHRMFLSLVVTAALSIGAKGAHAQDPDTDAGSGRLSDWSRVMAIDAGEPIVLTRDGAVSEPRQVIRADWRGLIVLDATTPTIPANVRARLAETASDRPECLLAAMQGVACSVDRDLRLTPNGVFLRGRKLAELEQVLRTVPRSDIAEIGVTTRPMKRAMWIGAAIGASLGVSLTWKDATRDCRECSSLAVLGAGLFGGIGTGFGAIAGAAAPRTKAVLYRRSELPDDAGPRLSFVPAWR